MQHRFPNFATVLKEMEAQNNGDDSVRSSHVHLSSVVFEAGLNPVANDAFAMSKARFAFDLEDSDLQDCDHEDNLARCELANRMESQSPASIRNELGLRAGMKRIELQRLRRSFAAANHPDRLPLEFRLAAEQRMKTANALLDNAMAAAINQL